MAIKVQTVEKADIKHYWEDRAPQTWYSAHPAMSLPWLNELASRRYTVFYEYLPRVAEFEFHAGEEVLEIGVGVGTDLVSYARHGARVSGIDLTENAILTTRTNLELHGLPYERLETADAEALPFSDESFDLVYSFGVLHHTPRTDLAIQEIHRILRPNGKAIIMLYARGWKHYFKRLFVNGILRGQLFRNSYESVVNRNTEVHGFSPLTYVFTRREIEKLFEPFGQVQIRRHRLGEYFDYAPYETWKLPGFVTKLCYFFSLDEWLGENYIIVARKADSPPRTVTFWQTLLKP